LDRQRLILDEGRGDFLNVDLDLKSTADLAPLLDAFGEKVMVLHAGRIGRKRWLRLMLTQQPKNPTDGILGLAKVVTGLRGRARTVWARARKEVDIGVQGGLQPASAEWLLEHHAVVAAARLGMQIRFTVYSPRLAVGSTGPPTQG
jgi:hypothetical protein